MTKEQNHGQNRYWPFEVLPQEQQTAQHEREVRFLETAYLDGFNPYVFGSENFGATAEKRGGVILYRGSRGKHWEVLLGTVEKTILAAHLDDFDYAAEAVIRWLRGVEGAEILEHIRGHLFIDRVTAPGFVLHVQEG
jgi:hypothetical protein